MAEEENGVYLPKVRRERGRFGEVAGDELDAVGQACLVWVAGDRAHRLIGCDELLDYLPADRARGSGDEDHPPDVRLTTSSDLPTTSRASMHRCASAASSSG